MNETLGYKNDPLAEEKLKEVLLGIVYDLSQGKYIIMRYKKTFVKFNPQSEKKISVTPFENVTSINSIKNMLIHFRNEQYIGIASVPNAEYSFYYWKNGIKLSKSSIQEIIDEELEYWSR